jgi:hypothetical protein
VDDIAWWAEVKDDQAVANKSPEAATASLNWATDNGIAFDHGKDRCSPIPQEEKRSNSYHQGGRKGGDFQQGGDALARSLA